MQYWFSIIQNITSTFFSSTTMSNIDIRGIKRGACCEKACDCALYEKPEGPNSNNNNCNYCGCKPAKHKNLSDANRESPHKRKADQSASGSTTPASVTSSPPASVYSTPSVTLSCSKRSKKQPGLKLTENMKKCFVNAIVCYTDEGLENLTWSAPQKEVLCWMETDLEEMDEEVTFVSSNTVLEPRWISFSDRNWDYGYAGIHENTPEGTIYGRYSGTENEYLMKIVEIVSLNKRCNQCNCKHYPECYIESWNEKTMEKEFLANCDECMCDSLHLVFHTYDMQAVESKFAQLKSVKSREMD